MIAKIIRHVEFSRAYNKFDRPVFIICPPRSGSTHLFEIIRRCEGVWSSDVEQDAVWWEVFPYSRLSEPSDFVSGQECSTTTLRQFRRLLYRHTLWARERSGESPSLASWLGMKTVRYIDKTISNCFHLEFIKRVFPDALYILLVRDPRAVISSMMMGWEDPLRFTKPQLNSILASTTSTIQHWAYPAPPSWHTQVNRPLEEICAWSWKQHLHFALRELRSMSEDQWITLRYEDLVSDPEKVIDKATLFAGLTKSKELRRYLRENPSSRTTVSDPKFSAKWRDKNRALIGKVSLLIRDLSEEIGYKLN